MAKNLQYRVIGAGKIIIPTPLYADDALLAEIVLGEEAHHWPSICRMFQRQGMPTSRAAVRGLHYVPAILKFLDRREGLAVFDEDYPDDGPDKLGPR
ncbi:MAG: hypothetical protein NTAFB05_20030 [Nitrobacter sp.]|uniref:hypothetical protein n=1 Tax=Nitrobacter sp. TaxID=29420 RepID=UPI00387E010C